MFDDLLFKVTCRVTRVDLSIFDLGHQNGTVLSSNFIFLFLLIDEFRYFSPRNVCH